MKILIVDDHILFREGLAAIIKAEPDIEIVGMAGSVEEAVKKAERHQPDLILMDQNLPDGSGVDATRRILSDYPQTKIVFLTMSEDDSTLFAAIRSGAKGYILKNVHPANLVASLRAVAQGDSAISPSMTLRLMEELSRSTPSAPLDGAIQKLTKRELEILNEVANGLSNQEIANHLFLSENTIKHHLHSIFEKLSLVDRKSAAVYARQHGLGQTVGKNAIN